MPGRVGHWQLARRRQAEPGRVQTTLPGEKHDEAMRMAKKDAVFYGILAAFTGMLIWSIVVIFLLTPSAQEQAGGLAQKIFYFHVPVAFATYVSGGVCFIASAVYLARPTESANAWARAGSDCAAFFGTMVLCSGPLWAKKAWGVYWTWDPQLTTLLLSVLVYYAVTLLRAFAGDGAAERRFAAALGIMGAVNLPIIHYSVLKWGGNHPTVNRQGGGGIDSSMKLAFYLGVFTLTLMLPPIVLWLRQRAALLQAQLDHAWEEALTRGMIELGTDDEDARAVHAAAGASPKS
jgi:heme exporter protein C